MNESEIVINGHKLTQAQAMAVRVAVTCFHSEMADEDALGKDEHGVRMATAYRLRLGEILPLLLQTTG